MNAPKNKMKILITTVLSALIVFSLVAEFTLLADKKDHWWNLIPGFYIYWGFLSCVVIIQVSIWIGKFFLFRNEDYYDN